MTKHWLEKVTTVEAQMEAADVVVAHKPDIVSERCRITTCSLTPRKICCRRCRRPSEHETRLSQRLLRRAKFKKANQEGKGELDRLECGLLRLNSLKSLECERIRIKSLESLERLKSLEYSFGVWVQWFGRFGVLFWRTVL
jgi:G3E family GTPase